jgi:hypothetical protein
VDYRISVPFRPLASGLHQRCYHNGGQTVNTERGTLEERRTLWMIVAVLIVLGGLPAARAEKTATASGPEIRVGVDEGDFHGSDQRALQAAVDYVAGLGGGTVHKGT